MSRIKIIATAGPQCKELATMTRLIKAGADIIRINCSHATPKVFTWYAGMVRTAARRARKPVALMLDLQGPRIRIGDIAADGMNLKDGERYVLAHAAQRSNGHPLIPITDPYLHLDVRKGEPIFLANGDIELVVEKTLRGRIVVRVTRGGVLFSHKAINVPHTTLRRSGVTAKDIKDMRNGVRAGIEYIALSFVQSADDVHRVRKLIKGRNIKIISKIERAVALKHIDEIIQASDGIMIARGDLGVEIPFEEVPIVQKNLIRHAHWHGKFAIIATQMLTSMIRRTEPTRAEVNDLANAVFDGGDAIMLSDETAAGDHPVRAVEVARRVLNRADASMHGASLLQSPREFTVRV